MKIRPMSDLHLEFDGVQPWRCVPIEGEEEMTLILAGDITAEHNQWKDNPGRDIFTPWVKDMVGRHKHVIYVPGNHELYAGEMNEVEGYWRNMANNFENLHFLNRESVVLDGVRFLGCTMWTELSPQHELYADVMNDFRYIWVEDEIFNTFHWRQEHEACRYFLDNELAKDFDGETVVVTHHLPSFQSIHEKYAGDRHNVFYASNLEKYMWYFPIKYWVHGHTHESCDYVVGDDVQATRVICNPRGYNTGHGDLNRKFDATLTFEV